MQHRRVEPAKGFSYTGYHRYLLTFCTYYRRPLFTDAAVVDLVLIQIMRAASDCGFAVLAYCFMPDHLHLLVRGESENSDCKDMIKRAKQYSGFYYSKAHGGQKKLWQRYAHDHVLRDEQKTEDAIRYILNNPVAAGLCARVGDYPFSGSQLPGGVQL